MKMILFNVLILGTFFSCAKGQNITLNVPQIQTISESELVELKLPKGVKKENISWDKTKNEVTILKNTSFSDMPNPDNDEEGFYWSVPGTIKVVFIEKNVKIIGGFRANGDLTIEGKDRATSEIFGTDTKAWALGPDAKTDPNSSCSNGAKGDDVLHDCEKWKYGAVSSTAANSTTVNVKNLTITNSRTYAITSFGPKIIVDNIHVKVSRPIPDYHSNSDGISAGSGSIVRNSKFDCWDDAIKLYRDITVENVTIVHNSNGAPFQLGWRNDNNVTNHTLKNILIEIKNKDYTNLALFSASLTSGKVNRNVKIDGLKVQYDASQKVKGTDPLPLFLMKSPDAVMTLNALNVDISAPKGLAGNGKVNLNICGSTDMKNKYLCGDVSKVNGCGW
jgi:hypothetical protein